MKQARTFPEIITLIGLRFKAFFLVFLLGNDHLFFFRRKYGRKYIQERIALTNNKEKYPAILFSCNRSQVRPVFIIVSGIKTFGNKVRLTSRLAKGLAYIGYHVLIYEEIGLQSSTFPSKSLAKIKGFIKAVSQSEFIDETRIVLSGSDFGARFVLSASGDPEINRMLKSVVVLSPVSDIKSLVKFSFTGKIRSFGKCRYLQPTPASRFVLIFNAFQNIFDRDMTVEEQIVMKNILKNQTTEALRKISSFDKETQCLFLAAFKDDLKPDFVHRFDRVDFIRLNKNVFGEITKDDLAKPVFLIHSIRDGDIDYGQSTRLFENLASSKGVYLHLTNFLVWDGFISMLKNPARWFSGAVALSRVFYKILALIYTDKNLPYNPEKTLLRIRL
ncbi:MAG TPA: hypothetical protein DHW42_04680 [Candidatus Marinimicrobia bacterium]|nr:hypothetical protein [Candidatus Neomarinimicrobiota bacterium]